MPCRSAVKWLISMYRDGVQKLRYLLLRLIAASSGRVRLDTEGLRHINFSGTPQPLHDVHDHILERVCSLNGGWKVQRLEMGSLAYFCLSIDPDIYYFLISRFTDGNDEDI